MKIAVYTIALNEASFVQRWVQSAADADYLLVADTGSSDDTIKKLRAFGVHVHNIHITPWRFDHARNASLALLPTDLDICISLDMDEVLVPGWRQELEAAWTPGTTRMRYSYVWDWDRDGKPKTYFFGEKIHHRHGYTWRHAAHETVYPLPGTEENVAWCKALRIHHHADKKKPRGQYLNLLRRSAQEEPADPRSAHYYGRELMYHRQYDAAIAELQRHLLLPQAMWKAERAASWRFIAHCHKRSHRPQEARAALMQSCAEAPELRENWYELAKFCVSQKDWAGGIEAVQKALMIAKMPHDHTCTAIAWGIGPYDIGSICAYYHHQPELARAWLTQALKQDPKNPRLLKNARWIFR